MPTFTDNDDREWTIEITDERAAEVKEACGIDLKALPGGPTSELKQLFDLVKCYEVSCVLLKDQFSISCDAERLGHALDGKSLAKMQTALFTALYLYAEPKDQEGLEAKLLSIATEEDARREEFLAVVPAMMERAKSRVLPVEGEMILCIGGPRHMQDLTYTFIWVDVENCRYGLRYFDESDKPYFVAKNATDTQFVDAGLISPSYKEMVKAIETAADSFAEVLCKTFSEPDEYERRHRRNFTKLLMAFAQTILMAART